MQSDRDAFIPAQDCSGRLEASAVSECSKHTQHNSDVLHENFARKTLQLRSNKHNERQAPRSGTCMAVTLCLDIMVDVHFSVLLYLEPNGVPR